MRFSKSFFGLLLMLAIFMSVQASKNPCTCENDNDVTSPKNTACTNIDPQTPFKFIRNGKCVDTCAYEGFDSNVNTENACSSYYYCKATNCAVYKPTSVAGEADCSSCIQCKPGYEIHEDILANANNRSCVLIELPKITCPSYIFELGPLENTTTVEFYDNVTATDNIRVDNIVCDSVSGGAFSAGVHTVSCTATDINGHSKSCSFGITVRDVTPPKMVNCPTVPYTAIVDNATLFETVIWTKPSAEDRVDGIRPVTCNRDESNTTFPLGTTQIICTAQDIALNQVQCQISVVVADSSAPNMTCPLSLSFDLPPTKSAINVDFSGNISAVKGEVPITNIVCSPLSNSQFQYSQDATQVTCTATATDGSTGQCTFSVNIFDVTDPLLTCPAAITVEPSSGSTTAVVTWTPSALDPVGLAGPIVCSPESGSSFSLGTTSVHCEVRDNANNLAYCDFNVKVEDRVAPSLTCPVFGPKILPVGAANMQVNWTVPVSDNAGNGAVVVTCSAISGSFFGPGSYSITCYGEDGSGNVGSCVFLLTVEDKEPPSITCPSDSSLSTDAGLGYATVNYNLPTVDDNYNANLPSCSPAAGQFLPGTSTVFCSVRDDSFNINDCVFRVVVTDSEKPLVDCPASQTFFVLRNESSYSLNTVVASPTDNVLVADSSITRNGSLVSTSTFTYSYPLGDTLMVHTAFDTSGNRNSCEWHIVVRQVGDFEKPNITNCPSEDLRIDTEPFKNTARLGWVPNVTDNVNVTFTSHFSLPTPDLAPSSAFPVGFTAYRYEASDAAGNKDVCTFNVYITDREAPRNTCPGAVSELLPVGSETMRVEWVEPVAVDNVAVANTTVNLRSGVILGAGKFDVVFTSMDFSGNSDSCNFTVTVTDSVIEKAQSSSSQTAAVGGAAVGVILVLVLLALLLYRRTKRRMLELEERATFHENEAWILAKAKALQEAMANKHSAAAPVAELAEIGPTGKRIVPPAPDLDDLGNLNQYMPYESIARELDRDQVELHEEIGSGEFGAVFSGLVKLGNGRQLPSAIKQLKPGAKEADLVKFKQEIAMVGQFQHPHVVELIGFVTKDEPVLMCLEFMELGSLQSYLKSDLVCGKLTDRELIKFATEVCAAMHYIGECGVVHRDLATRNVLINKDFVCKIADFGLAIDIGDAEFKVVEITNSDPVPIRWTAPEALEDQRFSRLSDVWSFGITMWEMWSYGALPYKGWTNKRVIDETCNKNARLSPPQHCPMNVYAIMIDCWNSDLALRLSFRRAYKRLVDAWEAAFTAEERVAAYDNVNEEEGAKLINRLSMGNPDAPRVQETRMDDDDDDEEQGLYNNNDGDDFDEPAPMQPKSILQPITARTNPMLEADQPLYDMGAGEGDGDNQFGFSGNDADEDDGTNDNLYAMGDDGDNGKASPPPAAAAAAAAPVSSNRASGFGFFGSKKRQSTKDKTAAANNKAAVQKAVEDDENNLYAVGDDNENDVSVMSNTTNLPEDDGYYDIGSASERSNSIK